MLRDLANHPARFQSFISQAFASAGADEATFAAATESLRIELRQGHDFGIVFELRGEIQMQGARAAYAANAPDGRQHIYLNADWLANADSGVAAKVLIEEIGHAIDQRLNGSHDSQGDEGELFADLVTGTALTAATTRGNPEG